MAEAYHLLPVCTEDDVNRVRVMVQLSTAEFKRPIYGVNGSLVFFFPGRAYTVLPNTWMFICSSSKWTTWNFLTLAKKKKKLWQVSKCIHFDHKQQLIKIYSLHHKQDWVFRLRQDCRWVFDPWEPPREEAAPCFFLNQQLDKSKELQGLLLKNMWFTDVTGFFLFIFLAAN